MTEEFSESTEPAAEPTGDSMAGLPNEPTEPTEDPSQTETEGQSEQAETEQTGAQEDLNRLMLKINGQEREYDLSDREALARDLQIGLSANERYQEAAQQRQQLEALQAQFQDFGGMLRENPMGVLESLGLNPRDIAEAYLQDAYSMDELPQHERDLMERERQLADREAQWEAQQAYIQQQQEAAQQQQAEEQLYQGIFSAVEGSTLPINEHTVKLMAKTMLENQIQDPAIALRLVEEQQKQLLSHYLDQKDPQKLASILGDKGQQLIRKKLVQDVTGNPQPKPQKSAPLKKEAARFIDEDELLDEYS